MAISGINNYKDVMYQWQSQQLKNTGNTTSTSDSAANIFGNTTSMVNQISSMIELTKYAMDSMGVSGDSRVTFSQITKYQQQLQNEFNQGVKQGFASSGIANIADLTFTLDPSGKITAQSANASDRAKAQSWLDANSSIGDEFLKSLSEIDLHASITLKISSTGFVSVLDSKSKETQDKLEKNEELAEEIRSAYEKMGINSSAPISVSFDSEGNLVASGDYAHQMNQWLATNSTLSIKIKSELDKLGVSPTSTTFAINQDGSFRVTVKDAELQEIQNALNSAQDIGKKIYNNLNNMKIDANANFSIQIAEDGSLNIISDHPDRDKIQRFFEENPDLVKKFRQIETLAGIEDARKAMQISPTEMRKRIQIESMASWWSTSGNAASYFGTYNDNSLSLLSGLNLKV